MKSSPNNQLEADAVIVGRTMAGRLARAAQPERWASRVGNVGYQAVDEPPVG